MGPLIAAAITTVAVVAFYGYLIARQTTRDDWRMLLLAFVIALPLQPLAYLVLRLPLHAALLAVLGPGAVLTVISLFYAALTEEPAKWLPLLVPAIRRRLTRENAVALALAVGLGFGVGEIWFLVAQLMATPEIAALPFYYFSGFFVERFLVCFMHGAFIAFAYKWLAEGRSFLAGGVIGMILHFLLNAPIFLAAINVFGLGRAGWQQVLMLWIAGFAIVLAFVVVRLGRRK